MDGKTLKKALNEPRIKHCVKHIRKDVGNVWCVDIVVDGLSAQEAMDLSNKVSATLDSLKLQGATIVRMRAAKDWLAHGTEAPHA